MSEVIVRMGKLPERCVDCAIRMRCVTYLMALYKTENVYELESLKPEIGSKDCAIVCVLPEQHGDLISREYAIATAVSGLTMELPPIEGGGKWIRVTEVRDSLKSAPTIVPATERSET